MVDKDLFLHDLAVVAILKCEAPYLKEWLDYHLLAGVDHFYLYDNESPDNQAEIAKPYVEAGLVDYIPAPGKSMQMIAYNDAIKRFKFYNRYLTFIDGDEFIYPKVDKKLGIAEVVDEILSQDPKASGLAIHWQMFGSNGEEKADYSRGVLERFTRRAPKDFVREETRETRSAPDNRYVKVIFNPRKINVIREPHEMTYFEAGYAVDENLKYARGMPTPIGAEKIVLNHYFCKTWEEYSTKYERGDVVNLNGARYDKIKFLVTDRNDEFDDGILKYRAERAKIYRQPDKSNADERLLNALERNLSPTLLADTPPSFYEGKVETFLTCLAVSSYLKKKLTYSKAAKFFEEMSLKAILKSFDKMSMSDAQLVTRELPNLLNLPYSTVNNLCAELLKRMPQIMDDMRLYRGNNWRYREYIEFDYIQYFLQEILNLRTLCQDPNKT